MNGLFVDGWMQEVRKVSRSRSEAILVSSQQARATLGVFGCKRCVMRRDPRALLTQLAPLHGADNADNADNRPKTAQNSPKQPKTEHSTGGQSHFRHCAAQPHNLSGSALPPPVPNRFAPVTPGCCPVAQLPQWQWQLPSAKRSAISYYPGIVRRCACFNQASRL